ncbi:MAG: hypothetical protein IPO26_16510 [Saprospiraceae bacterium]|nr:hypothetical protein [Saprospiraceae bacterium]
MWITIRKTNDIIKGNRDVTVDLIRNAAETYRFNPQYIFTGLGSMFVMKM